MALIYQTTDIITTGTALTTATTPGLVSGDTFILAETASIVAGNDGVDHVGTAVPDYTLILHGDVIAGQRGLIFGNSNAGSNPTTVTYNIHLSETGLIRSNNEEAIFLAVVSSNPDPSTANITNHGEISSQEDRAIYVDDFSDLRLTNTGVISSFDASASTASAVDVFRTDTAWISNSGLIQNVAATTSTLASAIDDVAAVSFTLGATDSVAILSNSGTIRGGSHAVFSSHDTTHITNSGVMEGDVFVDQSTGDTTRLLNSGSIFGDVVLDVGNDILRNSGEITGDLAMAFGDDVMRNAGLIDGIVSLGEGENSLDNSGAISGAVNGGSSADYLINSGTVGGPVSVSFGNDTLINSGTINADVLLGENNDLYVSHGGRVAGIIDMGDGDDTIRIDQADARIEGGTGFDQVFARSDVLVTSGVEEIYLMGSADLSATGDADTTYMQGNLGRNVLEGSNSAQTILAGGGDDIVSAEGGADTVRGNSGNDILDGGAEDDLIIGGIGDDTVIGGLGRDILYGQQGADVFVLNTLGESVAGATRDIIVDFVRGTDVIDLSAINQEAFAFIGTGAFSGSGGMELRYQVLAGTEHSLVQLDANGDGVPESELLVRGNPVLTADDFVL